MDLSKDDEMGKVEQEAEERVGGMLFLCRSPVVVVV